MVGWGAELTGFRELLISVDPSSAPCFLPYGLEHPCLIDLPG